MPPKREYSSDSDEKPKLSSSKSNPKSKSSSTSPKKPRTSVVKKSFTEKEELAFLEIIDEVVKPNLWNLAKNHPDLEGRKQAGIQGHWDSMIEEVITTTRVKW